MCRKAITVAVAALVAGMLGGAHPASAQLVSLPTSSWTVVKGSNGQALLDPNDDQQTGSGGAGGEADLVSSYVLNPTAQNPQNYSAPVLFTTFDRGSAASLTDGTLYFRARLGQAGNTGGFDRALFVYIFANNDDVIDLVAGVNNAGNAADRKVGLWLPGSGANNSPSTTSIAPLTVSPQGTAPNSYTYALPSSTNYNVSQVSSAMEPGQTLFDVDKDTNTDIFVSFGVSFSDITAQLQKQGITTNENSAFRYVVSTATQENSLNQDLGGIGNLTNTQQQQTYAQLGVYTQSFSPLSVVNLPEPSSVALALAGFVAPLGSVLLRRRKP